MWTLHPDCKNIIADSWKLNVVATPMFILTQKLKVLKEKLKAWNKDSFGNVNEGFCASSFLQVNSLVEDCILNLVNNYSNNILSILRSEDEIHNAVFSLNRDSDPGPDGVRCFILSTLFEHYQIRSHQCSARILSYREDAQQFQFKHYCPYP